MNKRGDWLITGTLGSLKCARQMSNRSHFNGQKKLLCLLQFADNLDSFLVRENANFFLFSQMALDEERHTDLDIISPKWHMKYFYADK